CGACSMPRTHRLLRLTFATIWSAPERPVFARTDRVHRIPELSRDSRVAWVLQHRPEFSAFDLVAEFAAELEVVALVIDRPRFVGLHINAVVGLRNQLFKAERLLAGQD